MIKLRLITLVIICFFSCKENKIVKSSNSFEGITKRALINGYFTEINDNIAVCFYQDNIFCFSKAENGFGQDEFMLHLIKNNNSFENNSFSKEKFIIEDTLKGRFSPLAIVKINANYASFKSVRIGQFRRHADNSTRNIWAKNILVKDILDAKQGYSNQFKFILNTNLINEDFENDLNFSAFFKTKAEFYILLSDTSIFFISKKKDIIFKKMMLHFLRDDNSFLNNSFDFGDHNYQYLLELPYSNFKIAKIDLPIQEDFDRIRIGQYNVDGNIWVQEIVLSEVYGNKLLKYNKEFEHL